LVACLERTTTTKPTKPIPQPDCPHTRIQPHSGLHFLAVQPDPDSEDLSGLWLLQDRMPPNVWALPAVTAACQRALSTAPLVALRLLLAALCGFGLRLQSKLDLKW